jgi:hypothetical protein
MQKTITSGETVFVALERNVWDTRQAVKAAIRAGQPKQRFTVTYEEEYYWDFLNQVLDDPDGAMEEMLKLGDKVVGEEDDAWRCASFWSFGDDMGVLLHRDGDKLFCSCLPLMTTETAEREHAASVALGRLAQEANEMPVRLEKDIQEGMHKLSDILEIFSEAMDV